MTKALSREEKERLYISKADELQRIWKNPSDPNYDHARAVRELSNERLDELLRDTVSQIRFEKVLRAITMLVGGAVAIFVAAGVIGLLLFGIKQLLAMLR